MFQKVENFCNELKKNYLVNNGKGLSVLIYFKSKKLLQHNLKIRKKLFILK